MNLLQFPKVYRVTAIYKQGIFLDDYQKNRLTCRQYRATIEIYGKLTNDIEKRRND